MPDPASPKTYRIRRGEAIRRGRGAVNGRAARNPAPSGIFVSGATNGRERRVGEHPFASVRLPPRARRVRPGGALAATLPGFEPRAEQAALAAAVELRARDAASTSSPRPAPARARASPTCCPRSSRGSGSSSRPRRRRSRSSCSPRRSRRRRARSGARCDVAVLKGRQNYVCRKQLQSFGPMLLRDARDEEAFEALEPWLAETETGDRAELPFEPSEALWAELAVGPDRCAGRRCPFLSTCFAEAARARAGEAELVIANHALYFADLAAGGGVLPEHDAVVFDEAHRLEETAATWLGGRVSRAGLRRLAADVERGCREADGAAPGTRARPRRAGRRPPAARRRAALRTAAPARAAGRGRARARRRARRARGRAAAGGARSSTGSRAAPLERRRAGRGVPRAGRARARRLGRARRARLGAGRRLAASCASGSGTRARPRSSSRRR